MKKAPPCCPQCGHRIRNKVYAYSSGSGCLTLAWRETQGSPVLNRKVTKADAERYLKLKENEHLTHRNWVPVFIGGKWVLARVVKRTGPNRLSITGISYSYELTPPAPNGQISLVRECDLTTTFKVRVKGKMIEHEMLNQSIRMAIRYFLDHEKELKPFFAGYKVIKGDA